MFFSHLGAKIGEENTLKCNPSCGLYKVFFVPFLNKQAHDDTQDETSMCYMPTIAKEDCMIG